MCCMASSLVLAVRPLVLRGLRRVPNRKGVCGMLSAEPKNSPRVCGSITPGSKTYAAGRMCQVADAPGLADP
jgi:hypothetical protein